MAPVRYSTPPACGDSTSWAWASPLVALARHQLRSSGKQTEAECGRSVCRAWDALRWANSRTGCRYSLAGVSFQEVIRDASLNRVYIRIQCWNSMRPRTKMCRAHPAPPLPFARSRVDDRTAGRDLPSGDGCRRRPAAARALSVDPQGENSLKLPDATAITSGRARR